MKVMKYRALIEQLCQQTQDKLNFGLKIDGDVPNAKIVFTLEEKPSNYFFSAIPIRVQAKLGADKTPVLWGEIFLDGVCIFRVNRELPCNVEELCAELLSNVFTHGIAESYAIISKRPFS